MLYGKKYASKDKAVKQNFIIGAYKCIFQSLSAKPRPAGLFIDLYCLTSCLEVYPSDGDITIAGTGCKALAFFRRL